jgi:hypothetical protein
MSPNLPRRRHFLRSASTFLGLPWLDSFSGFAHANTPAERRQRLLLINVPLGIFRDAFVPQQSGANYHSSEYLSVIDEFRQRMTVISGLDHPGVGGGHSSEGRIFTGIPSNSRNVRSLDQYLASKIGQHTRFDTLTLSAGRNIFSWTDSGTAVPSESKMSEVYAKLFLRENADSTRKVVEELKQGQGIMDLVEHQAESLKPGLSRADQDKLAEYFASVRETERRLIKAEQWVHTPKPEVDATVPTDPASPTDIVSQLRNVCDMTHLAFQTDSTRIVTFGYFQQNNVQIDGVTNGYHPLSHHGQDPRNIEQLKLIELELFKELKVLLTKLEQTREGEQSLLDQTSIIVTSNLGNASNHSTRDLPVLLLGGSFAHGQHLAFEPSTVPLSNLFVSVLNQFGLSDKTFATATGPLKGLEIG